MKRALSVAVMAGLAASVAVAQPSDNSQLRNGLAPAARLAQPGEMLPIVIVLAEQTPQGVIDAGAALEDLGARRATVLGALRETAARTQGELLDVLAQGQQAGAVGERIRPLYIANMIATEATRDMIVQLSRRADVGYIHLDKQIGEEVFPVEPSDLDDITGDGGVTAAITCGVNKINAPGAWNIGYTGDGIVVGVIDTGLCRTHPDIAGNVWVNPGEIAGNGIDDDANGYVDDINGWNFQNNNNNVDDTNGHGTHTAGTVAGAGTNGEQTGVAPDAEIMVLEFWNSFSGESTVWEGMQYGAANGAHVLTASLGWPHSTGPDRAMWRMVSENTFAASVPTVFAAGNEGSCCGVDSVRTPGDVPDMITAGATDCNDRIASFSSRGPVTWQNVSPYFDWPNPPGKLKPTVSAPGVDTLSLDNSPCTGYAFLSGTSMATPHIAGVMALMLQANPDLDHYEIKQILKDTSLDLGAAGPDNTYGHGRVDAQLAVEAALSMGGCDADLDGDGDADSDDFFVYLDAFAADDLPVCDLDGDGDCDSDDFFDYLDQFATGC